MYFFSDANLPAVVNWKQKRKEKNLQNILTKANTQPGKKKNVLLLNNDHDKKTYTNTKQGQTSLKNASLANK